MAALTSTLFFCFGFLCVFVFVSADQKTITAESGQDVTLTCRAPNYNIIVVEWSRAAGDKEYVFMYRDGQFVSEQQHPSFKSRVELQDRQMKGGDVSVILKDVTFNDTGTYECRVIQSGSRSLSLLSTITLRVAPPPPGPSGGGASKSGGEEDGGKEGGAVRLRVGLSVAAVLLVAAAVGFVIYRKRHRVKRPHSVV